MPVDPGDNPEPTFIPTSKDVVRKQSSVDPADGRNEANSASSAVQSTYILPGRPEPNLKIADRYVLIEQIGEGGMGEVWIAKQTDPVKRNVALKLIKAGMDSKAVLVRFEQERQALALMDHPNIARVYDAGVTPSGHPFFAMELVNGQPLTKYCDSNRLSPRSRLELFVPICQAIQHAHQKGIVHRDLKPANILVTVVDGKAVPKVIDFGVAKATGGKLTEETLSTGFGAVVGTLEYMSPEQAGTTGADVDTRADIYSLGVVLYELLTGLRPFDGERLRKAALSEMIRIIREDDPSRPSTRLSTDASLPSMAALRQTEPRKLMAQLRGDLDWVVMKCLEKNRERRYETANGLARDIARYLADEPVEAKPPSAAYRLKKLYTRNKAKVIATALLLISMVVGIIGTTVGLLEARRQTNIADKKAKEANAAKASESEQREVAEQANQLAIGALQSFTSSLMSKLLGGRSQLDETEISILNDALKQWEVFAESQGSSPQARRIRAIGATNVATIQNKLGMAEQAIENDRKALGLWDSLVQDQPDNVEDQRKLAISHQNLGSTLRGIGQRREAGKHFRAAQQIFESLLGSDGKDPDLRERLADSHISVGNVDRDFGEWSQSKFNFVRALELFEALAAEFPSDRSYQDGVAGSHWSLAFLNKRLAQQAESVGHYHKAISVYKTLAQEVPTSIDYRLSLGQLHRELGVAVSDGGDDTTGATELSLAIPILEGLAKEFPSVPNYQFEYARAVRDYAQILSYLKRYDESQLHYESAMKIQTSLVSEFPANLSYANDFGISCRMFGDLLTNQGKLPEAETSYSKAIEILIKANVQDRTYVTVRRSLVNCYSHRAELLDSLQRHGEAVKDWDKALEFCEEDKKQGLMFARVDSRIRAGDVAESIAVLEELAKIDVPHAIHWFNFARLFAISSQSLPDRKEELASNAVTLLRKAIALGLNDFERIEQDKDLLPLADRDDFKALLAP